jgi:hypothetical protein
MSTALALGMFITLFLKELQIFGTKNSGQNGQITRGKASLNTEFP